MASSGDPPKPRGGLSLYANLLDPSSDNTAGTISRAPVLFQQDTAAPAIPQEDDTKKKLSSSALRFQPTKRPQAQKSKPKPAFFSKGQISSTSSTSPLPSSDAASAAPLSTTNQDHPSAAQPFKSSVADWTNEADDDDYYAAQREKHERGGRKKRKKNNKDIERDTAPTEPAWDAIYDPTRPNDYSLYIHSEEKYREIRDWKNWLYAHRLRANAERRYSSDMTEDEGEAAGRRNPGFAPPPSFAPPTTYDEPPSTAEDDDNEDPYKRRIRMSQAASQHSPPTPPPPPPPSSSDTRSIPPPPPPVQGTSKISRAPVRYNLPQPNISAEELEEAATEPAPPASTGGREEAASEEPKSNRPGQKGFAARIMAKYGWEKGQGLGAAGTGIVTPLQAQANKRKKLSDAEGGGFASPAIGKIVGGKRSAAVEAEERKKKAQYGVPSEVVCLQGMLSGMDVADPEARGELVEEIGVECGEKYGRVERVFIHPNNLRVFVKFTSQLSALRALDALEGRVFSGNKISARFWDAERFEAGDYDV